MSPTQIEDYHKQPFTATIRGGHQVTHDVYSRGEGKLVVIIQELPGIGQETLSLADRFVERGYKVFLPHLFGPIGRIRTLGNMVQVLCMRKEFRIFSNKGASPVVDWLRALCRQVKEEHQAPGVAAIGMCLTGNFAISLMVDDAVLAGFASQPSLPILNQTGLHLDEEDIPIIKRRLEELGPMHCGRFAGDLACTAKKFETLDKAFNTDEKERIIFHTLPGKGHSILTLDFNEKDEQHPTQQALREVMDYFDEALNR